MNLFVQTLVGIILLIGGVSLLYFFMTGLATGANVIFLVLSLVLIGGGAFLFVRISKIENANPEFNDTPSKGTTPQTGSKLLDKNNQMVKDWAQLNSKKDNLKAVQMAVGAEVQAKSNE